MTNPTLERAARAAYEAHGFKPRDDMGGDLRFDDLAPFYQNYWINSARAVLMAVRSDEKIANMAYEAESVAHCDWDKIWERQIDAILDEENK